MDNFLFDISVSDQTYKEKPCRKSPLWAKMTFTQRCIDIDTLYHLIKEGRCFAHVFKTRNVDSYTKTKANFLYTQVIPIDIDDYDCSMEDFVDTLDYKPTIAYETFSNLEDGKGYRFRLLYVFDNRIDIANYEILYNAVCKANNIGCDDKAMTKLAQGYFGTGTNRSVIAYGCIYNDNAFSSFIEDLDDMGRVHATRLNKQHINDNRVAWTLFEDKDFEKEWNSNVNVSDFLRNMGMKYFTREKSLVEHEDGALWTELEDTDYYMIKRQWHRAMLMGRQVSGIKRLRYGQHRKTKIFRSLMTRRLIDPTIRLEHLCWAALYELHYFVDNTELDHKITKIDLLYIAKRAMSENLDNYRERLRTRKSFEINKEECRKQGISVQQAVGKANGAIRHREKMKRYEQMSLYFNPELKREENMKIFEENGIFIKRSAYYEFSKWYKKNNDKIYREMKEKENYKYPELQEEDGRELLRENNEMLKELLSYVKPEKEKTREEAFLEFFNSKNLVGS